MWNSGITFRHRSVGVESEVAAMLAADASRLPAVSGTIFGRAGRARGEQQQGRVGVARTAARPSPGDRPEQVIDPAAAPRRARSPESRIDPSSGARRGLVAAEHHHGTNPERGELLREIGLRQIGREGCARWRPRRCPALRRPLPVRSEGQPRPDRYGAYPAGMQVAHDRFNLLEQGVVRRRLPPRRQQR